MTMQPRHHGTRPRRRFTSPDWEIQIVNRDGTPARGNIPALLLDNLDDAVQYRFGGAPIPFGTAVIRIPYTPQMAAARFVLATDLRTKVMQQFSVHGIDDEPRSWSMICQLERQELDVTLAAERHREQS